MTFILFINNFFFRNYYICLAQFQKRRYYSKLDKFIYDELYQKNLFLITLIRTFKSETIIPFILFILQVICNIFLYFF